MAAELKQTIPVLRMFDIAKPRGFYLDYLGFTVDFEHRFYEGAPLFMGISRGGIRPYLREHHGDGTPGTHIIVEVSAPFNSTLYFSERVAE